MGTPLLVHVGVSSSGVVYECYEYGFLTVGHKSALSVEMKGITFVEAKWIIP